MNHCYFIAWSGGDTINTLGCGGNSFDTSVERSLEKGSDGRVQGLVHFCLTPSLTGCLLRKVAKLVSTAPSLLKASFQWSIAPNTPSKAIGVQRREHTGRRRRYLNWKTPQRHVYQSSKVAGSERVLHSKHTRQYLRRLSCHFYLFTRLRHPLYVDTG